MISKTNCAHANHRNKLFHNQNERWRLFLIWHHETTEIIYFRCMQTTENSQLFIFNTGEMVGSRRNWNQNETLLNTLET